MNVLRFPSPCAFFFHCIFIVSSKATIFISKSFNFYLQTPRMCFVFPLHVLFFDFSHCMFVVSSKATIFISKLHECASFSLSMCFFFIFFTACSLFLLKQPFLSPNSTNVLRFSSSCAFFRFFFTVCSLFLLKLPFLSQKVSIFISKLHECTSFSLSMCFLFFYFFHCMFIVSSKATIFIFKSFDFYLQTP
ncbi:hypothetical protein AAZV13_03G026400 [Glycine max]